MDDTTHKHQNLLGSVLIGFGGLVEHLHNEISGHVGSRVNQVRGRNAREDVLDSILGCFPGFGRSSGAQGQEKAVSALRRGHRPSGGIEVGQQFLKTPNDRAHDGLLVLLAGVGLLQDRKNNIAL